MSQRSVRIDFNRTGRPVEVVDRWELRHPERTWGVGPLRRRSTLRIPVDRLWVAARLPECLRVRDGAEVVTLEPRLSPNGGGPAPARSAELRDFTLQSFSFPYDIVLDPAQIEDVLDDAVSSAEMQVEVGSAWKGAPEAAVQRFTVRLELVRARANPRCWIELEPEFEAGYEHRRGKRVRLGTFWVENAVPVRYAHPFDCTARVRSEAWPAPGAVSFGAAHEVEGATGAAPGAGGLVAADAPGVAAVRVDADGERLEVRALAPRARVGVPLYVDLQRVANPDDAAELAAAVAVEYRTEGRTASLPDCEARYRVLRDRRTTALLAVLHAAGEERGLRDGGVVALDEGVQWSPGRSGLLECFTVRLGNSAESGMGRVELRGLALEFDDTAGGAAGVRWREGGSFLVNGAPVAALPDRVVFPDGVRAFRDLVVAFRHADLQEVAGGAAPVGCTVRCEYREVDAVSADAPWRELRADVRFRVERDLGPEWLAVDFGTSAIVVARHASGVGEVPLVNLQEPLLRRVNEVDRDPAQVAEFGTPFLSSSIKLKPGRLGAPGRAESIVELAPVRRELNASTSRVPYLKALIGTTFLPDLAGMLGPYEYQTAQGEPRGFAEHPLRTDEVLRETYARLLTDYVVPATGGAPPAKVVFSVPNSFTPRHLDQLRSLIAGRFPEFSREYLSFISESDAVACFYLAGWGRLNAARPAAQRDALRAGDEHVLVYDMGAGTLDLTYLRIRTDAAGSQAVTIIGRMGRSTAGNYLDYLLAREIVREHGAHFAEAMFGTAGFEHALEARDRFKRLVQDEIKPRLDEEGTFALPADLLREPETVEVDLEALRASRSVQEFLHASTADVLENFFALFPSPEGRQYLPGSLPIDTMVLSGRSMQLRLLRRAVEVELKEWVAGDDPYVVQNLDAQTLKSAVVQGALQFAALYRRQGARARVRIHNRNLQARYGILYNDPLRPDQVLFKELLNPSTRPLPGDPVVEDGLTIHTYDTDVFDADPTNDHRPNFVDLGATAVAYFVQSFAADTAAQASAGRYEYITRMGEFTAQQVGYGARPDRVPVRVTVDEKNQMSVRVGQQTDDPVSPLRMNLHDSPTFRAGLWPFLPGGE